MTAEDVTSVADAVVSYLKESALGVADLSAAMI